VSKTIIYDKMAYRWFFSSISKDGWWSFSTQNNTVLEDMYTEHLNNTLVLNQFMVDGKLYTVDFHNMVQYPTTTTNKKRDILRMKSDECAKIRIKTADHKVSPTG